MKSRKNLRLTESDRESHAILKKSIENDRGYASFWEFSVDRISSKRCKELAVAQVLIGFLRRTHEEYVGEMLIPECDPPDILIRAERNRTIGVEVSEIVDQDSVERHRNAKDRDNKMLATEWAQWSPESCSKKIAQIIERKDRQLKSVSFSLDKIILGIFTDEPIIDEAMSRNLANEEEFYAENISSAFLVLSYRPICDRMQFDDGYPIFQLNLAKR